MAKKRYEFFYKTGYTMKHMSEILNEKSDYYDEDMEIIHIEKDGETDDGRGLYNYLCKGTY